MTNLAQIFPTEQGRHQLGVLGWMRPLEVTPISKLIASDTEVHQLQSNSWKYQINQKHEHIQDEVKRLGEKEH